MQCLTTGYEPPVHLHVLANIEGLDDETRLLIAPAVEAFETAVVELGNIHKLRLAANKNAALTPEAKVLQVAAYADKKVAHVARMIDAAHAGFFQALGDSIVTGPTLTNVNDFRAIVIDGSSASAR
jgi:hypothetical protein